jgi:hypothetical protein
MTDWSRLQPFRGDRRRSFEELCYQLAVREYGHLGRFIRIDDSGGGDGVEFFLALDGGEEWGWQAKFFHPDPRIAGSRKRQVEDSLRRSLQRHPGLSRWFLCTPTSFTTGETESELRWWDRLRERHPGLEMVHWGDSELTRFLAQPASAGQRAYFLDEITLDADWFRTRLDRQLANLRDRFEHGLHAVTEADMRVHFLAGDGFWKASLWESAHRAYEALCRLRLEWEDACAMPAADAFIRAATVLLAASEAAAAALREVAERPEAGVAEHAARLGTVMGQLEDARLELAKAAIGAFTPELIDDEDQDVDRPVPAPLQILIQPASRAVQILQRLHQAIDALADAERPVMHVIGAAGMGKTHGAAHACFTAVEDGRPAVLLLGARFHRASSLESQILDQLDVPRSCTWEEFAGALDAYAAACGSPALLVIDALNEAEAPAFWRQSLPGLGESVKRHRHLRLVTTCRPSYVATVWGDPPEHAVEARGFAPEEVPWVMERYFARYRLVVDTTLSPPWHFQHPLYLKVFCESENPEPAAPKEVFLGAQTLFSVLDRYLARTSRSLCAKLDRRPNDRFIEESLAPFCAEIWESGRRTMPIERAEAVLDGSTGAGWSRSLTQALLDEGLLLHADLVEGEGEQVGFTYDLLGGYLIARRLLAGVVRGSFGELVNSTTLCGRLAAPAVEDRHLLHEDILRGLAAAAPEQTGIHLFEAAQDPVIWNAGVDALFEIDPKWINDEAVTLVAALFSRPGDRIPLLERAINTALSPRHPLNLRLWDELLRALPMCERDLAWGVQVQQSLPFWEWLCQETERACRSERPPHSHTQAKIELAATGLRWLLASTARGLRDRASRALYWYGRRYPDALAALTLDSLPIDDPYVPERCLATCFGVAMAFRTDPAAGAYRGGVLADVARRLHAAMFARSARYPSTHALLRDSAAGIVALAAHAHPGLFTAEELDRARAPFPQAPGRANVDSWGIAEDRDRGRYHDGNDPLRLDFVSHTVGGLVPGRRLDDDEHPEYRRVMGQLRWRMYDLGYRLDVFGELDVRTDRVVPMPPAFEPRPYFERFGQKYAWIAFFELYGWRHDRGLLAEGLHEPRQRPAEVDLEASFPDAPRDLKVVANLTLPRSMPLRRWVEEGPVPDASPWLLREKIGGSNGPWVLLDAVVEERDPVTGHGLLMAVRSVLVARRDAAAFARELAGVDPARPGLLVPPWDLHTYAGEAPWRETYPSSDPATISLPHSRSGSERTFTVHLPVRHNAWQTHHSEIMGSYGTALVAKRIAERFDLWMRLPSWDFHQPDGRRATLSTLHQRIGVKHALTWVRQDLLATWLREEQQGLIWAVNGERKRSVHHLTFRYDPDPGPHHRPFAAVYRLVRGRPLPVVT